jgi:hypothetical protein
VRSGIELPPGEEFVLGPRKFGQIDLQVNNGGPGPLSLAFELPTGKRTTPDLLEAGQMLQVEVPAGRSAVIHNPGPGTTRVALVARGGEGVGMGFQPAESPGYSARPLTAEQAQFDFELFRRVLEDVHPGYGRYESADETGQLMDTVASALDNGVTDSQLYLDVSRVLAHVRCDHTKAELPEAIEAFRNQEPSYLPFTFRLFGDQMLVDRVASEVTGLKRGDRVIRLNGREVSEVLSQISELVSVDGYTDNTRYVEMENSSEYLGDAVDHFWPFLYGWVDRWTIETEADDNPARNTGRKVDAPAITYPQWLELASEGERFVNFPDAVEFKMLDDLTGYLSIGTFVNYREPVPPEEVFEPIFSQLKQAGATRLVLDLRDCGGGSDDVPAVLATYLSDKRVELAKRPPWVRTYKFGDLREHLSTWDESVFSLPEQLFRDLGNGYFEMNIPGGSGGDLPTRANTFDGDVVVLSSAANASGATMFIAMAQEHYGVRVVGEPTGGSAEGPTAGVIFFLTLPNSGIKVRVPGIRSWLNVENPSPGMGVVPDVEVRPTVDDWLTGRDAALEAARNLPRF